VAAAGRRGHDGYLTTPGNLAVLQWERLRASWPAFLLPLVAADTLGLLGDSIPLLLVVVTVAAALVWPKESAWLTPFACLAYGGYGLFVYHSLSMHESQPVVYGVVRAGANGNAGFVVAQAVVFLAAGTWLLAVTGAPGGAGIRRAIAQLRGTDGGRKTVPPLLLLPVLFLWEELFSGQIWFEWSGSGRVLAVLLAIAGLALVARLPRTSAVLAVAGLLILGLFGVIAGIDRLWFAGPPPGEFDGYTGPPRGLSFGYEGYPQAWLYGMVPLSYGISGLFAMVQGLALGVAGGALIPRLPWDGESELARQARALTQRVDRLTRTRSDATEAAVAELRRIERDLHDGAQARLVAVGMSLRAAEELMRTSPEAALALVAEARETSSRALTDLRDLVRGIYPPVLADRGLADAVRALALDAPVTVETDIALAGEPPMPIAAAVYFGIAEALTNTVRHAEARTVQISLDHSGGLLRATVTDDGQGGADSSLGTGLAGVESRLASFDGILAVSSPPGGPTILAIEVACALSGHSPARAARFS
jgi:signal transduction histidine kinase